MGYTSAGNALMLMDFLAITLMLTLSIATIIIIKSDKSEKHRALILSSAMTVLALCFPLSQCGLPHHIVGNGMIVEVLD